MERLIVESQALCQSSATHIQYNVLQDKRDLHTTRLNSKAKSNRKKKRKEDKYLISIDQILLMKNFKAAVESTNFMCDGRLFHTEGPW